MIFVPCVYVCVGVYVWVRRYQQVLQDIYTHLDLLEQQNDHDPSSISISASVTTDDDGDGDNPTARTSTTEGSESNMKINVKHYKQRDTEKWWETVNLKDWVENFQKGECGGSDGESEGSENSHDNNNDEDDECIFITPWINTEHERLNYPLVSGISVCLSLCLCLCLSLLDRLCAYNSLIYPLYIYIYITV